MLQPVLPRLNQLSRALSQLPRQSWPQTRFNSNKAVGNHHDRVQDLLDQFKNPSSPFYLAPGESGPAWPEPGEDESPASFHASGPAHSPASIPAELIGSSQPDTLVKPPTTPQPTGTGTGATGFWPNEFQHYTESRMGARAYARENGFDVESMIEWPVAWGETDQFRHINNVHFARYFETARIRIMQGCEPFLSPKDFKDLMNGTGTGLVIKSIKIDYKRPVNFPDSLVIMSRPTEIDQSRASFNLKHSAWSLQQQKIVTQCESVQVMYDFDNFKKGKMSDEVKRALEGIRKRGSS